MVTSSHNSEEHKSPEEEECQSPTLSQTTEEIARDVVAAAASVRPRPSIVFSSSQDNGNRTLRKFQRQLSRLWRQGSSYESKKKEFFNPEHLTKQKRQWTKVQLRSLEGKLPIEPSCLFEHMVLIGLHPKVDLAETKDELIKRRMSQKDLDGSELRRDVMRHHYKGDAASNSEPQILFVYPPGKRLPMRLEDLPAFCFPSGLEIYLLERTPSLSELNEVLFAQDHMKRDDLSYVFSVKVADNATLYGVCVCVPELVDQAPAIMSGSTDDNLLHSPLSRYSLSSYRCYCILTKLPFFSLHFEVLNRMITQERLERINRSVDEMSSDTMAETYGESNGVDLAFEKQLSDSSIVHEEVPLIIGEINLEDDGTSSVTCDIPKSSVSDRIEIDMEEYVIQETLQDNAQGEEVLVKEERVGGDSLDEYPQAYIRPRHERYDSLDSLSSVFESFTRIANSEDESEFEEASPSGQEYVKGLDSILSWAEANNNRVLQILCKYYQLPVPARGSSIFFHPLEHLQPLRFTRSGQVSTTLIGGRTLDLSSCRNNLEIAEAQAAITLAEEAFYLSIWTIATVCRVLSLDNLMSSISVGKPKLYIKKLASLILTLFAAALLEKQVVVISPNLGVLSAVVLSIIPLLRPFQWQSLLLPVLPDKMLDFLDAPVPFIVGVQDKSAAIKMKASNVIAINVMKNKVVASSFPQLPRLKELASALTPYHSKLAAEEDFARKNPVCEYNDAQAEAAEGFLGVLRSYLESLCMNLRMHTITNVQSNSDKVSLLLKDSFLEDFSTKDRPFMKLFMDTQLFSVHTDAVLSFFESD